MSAGMALAFRQLAHAVQDPTEALKAIDRAREISAVAEPDVIDQLIMDSERARVLRRSDRLSEAESTYVDVIGRWNVAYPNGHPTMSSPLNDLGYLRQLQGDLEGAVAAYSQGLELVERFTGPAHPAAMQVRTNLASTLSRLGDDPGAMVLLTRNVEVLEAEFPERHLDIAARFGTVGGAHMLSGRSEDAVLAYRDALQHHLQAGGTDAPLAITRLKLSAALVLSGQQAEAEIEWTRGAGFLLRPDGGPLNQAGIGQLTWLALQCERHGAPEHAGRLRTLIQRVSPEQEDSATLHE